MIKKIITPIVVLLIALPLQGAENHIDNEFYGSEKLNFIHVKELTFDDLHLDPYQHCLEPYVIRGAAKSCSGMNWTYKTLAELETNAKNASIKINIEDSSFRQILELEDDYGAYFTGIPLGNHFEHFLLFFNAMKKKGTPFGVGGHFSMYNTEEIKDEQNLFSNNLESFSPYGIIYNRKYILAGNNKFRVQFHTHPTEDSFLIEFKGPKIVTLASPDELHKLSTPNNIDDVSQIEDDMCRSDVINDCCSTPHAPQLVSKLNIENPDFDSHSNYFMNSYYDVTFYQATLEKGDMLYIPANWYHNVIYKCEDGCLGTANFVKNCTPCLEVEQRL